MKNNLILSAFLIIFIVVGFSSCKEDEQFIPKPIVNKGAGRIVLVNEGGFQKGNASLGVFNRESKEVTSNIFSIINAGTLVGDVLQSMSLINGDYWMVVNNSGKIWVVDSNSFQIKHEITGLSSPRHVAKINQNQAIVTDLFGGSLSVVNSNNFTVEKTIPLAGWTEDILLLDDKVWISNKNTDLIYTLNPTTLELGDSLRVRMNGARIIKDPLTADLILFCEAQWDLSTKACLYRIDPNAMSVLDSIEFTLGESVNHMTLNSTGTELLYINNGLKKMSLNFSNPNIQSLSSLQGLNVYGLGVDPNRDEIHVSDAKDFNSKSTVHVLNQKGEEQLTYVAGVNCNGFIFE
jgi:hypothetical protein